MFFQHVSHQPLAIGGSSVTGRRLATLTFDRARRAALGAAGLNDVGGPAVVIRAPLLKALREVTSWKIAVCWAEACCS